MTSAFGPGEIRASEKSSWNRSGVTYIPQARRTAEMYFLTVLEAEKSKIEMPSIWFLDTAVSLACRQLAAFSLCPRVAFPQCWGTGREGECALIRTLILLNQSPTLMTSFKFNYSLRGPHLQRQPYRGLGLQHTNLRRTQTFSPY